MAKRRTPPLFEVLSGPDRRPGPGGGVIGRRMEPVQVQIPAANGQRPQPGATPRAKGLTGNPIALVCVILAGLFLVGACVWYVAFQLGQEHKKKELDPYLGTTPREVLAPPTPANPTGTSGTGLLTPQPDIQPPEAPSTLTDPRKPGTNYLHIVTLTWKDAEKAVAYLGRNGVPAAAVPAKKVDPAEAKAKNLPHLVFALEGIPSEQYKSSESKRAGLVKRVQQIGKKWQSEEKGPSDFGEPGWALFK